MAKVTSWGFTRLRGKVKEAEFRERKNKVIELSKKRVPSNPRTDAQKTIRSAYGKCVEKWNKLSYDEKQSWRAIGNSLKMTGYNAYMRQCISEALTVGDYEITIDNTGNANTLTEFQILLNVSGDATFFEDCENNQVYLEFYDEDQTTLLKHWVEKWDITNHNAKIWIKVPSIPGSATKKIYLKINKDRTEDLSSGEDTFEFFDDFEGNTTKLNDGTATLSYVTGKDGDGIQLDGGSEKRSRRDNNTTLGRDLIYEVWIKIPSGNSVTSLGGISLDQSSDCDGYGCIVDERSTYGDMQIRKGPDTFLAEGTKKGQIQTDAWYLEKVIWKSDGLIDFYLYDEDGNLFENISVTDTSYTEGKVGLRTYNKTHFDTYKVRKYASPEPSVSYEKT